MKTATVLSRPKERAPYTPYGAAYKLWCTRRAEVLIAGPADTGKSRAALEKVHYCCDRYPNMRALMVRKTRESLTQSTMVTYEKKVLPYGWFGNLIRFNTVEQQYEYPNGSILAVGGLDKSSKVMSSEWDMIYVPEATELTEDNWEHLTTRVSGRSGGMPYAQLLADCNPHAPHHWLKKRCERGGTLLLESRHVDNPSFTPQRQAVLDRLTGVRRKRLRDGIWAAAEGMVYDEWDPALHVIDRFDIPPLWPRYWAIDWGYRNPFCWQDWAQSHDGDLYCYREIYVTGQLVEDLARQIMQLTASEPRPVAIICDHNAEDRATFERHSGMSTTPANKPIAQGIQAVKARLRPDRRGKPGMYYLRDILVARDPLLDEKKLPASTIEEYESHEWDISNGRKTGEVPVDKDNHGLDTTRYMIMHVDGGQTIGDLDTETVEALRDYRGY